MIEMKLSSSFILHRDGEETLLVSTGASKFSGLVRCNPTAAFIVDCLSENTTEAKIAEKMCKKWDVAAEKAMADVKKITAQLRKIGAIHD